MSYYCHDCGTVIEEDVDSLCGACKRKGNGNHGFTDDEIRELVPEATVIEVPDKPAQRIVEWTRTEDGQVFAETLRSPFFQALLATRLELKQARERLGDARYTKEQMREAHVEGYSCATDEHVQGFDHRTFDEFIETVATPEPQAPSVAGETLLKQLDKLHRMRVVNSEATGQAILKDSKRGALVNFEQVKTVIAQWIVDHPSELSTLTARISELEGALTMIASNGSQEENARFLAKLAREALHK